MKNTRIQLALFLLAIPVLIAVIILAAVAGDKTYGDNKYELTGDDLHGATIKFSQRSDYKTYGAYLKAVKKELDSKKSTLFWNKVLKREEKKKSLVWVDPNKVPVRSLTVSVNSGTGFTKEHWDAFFQLIQKNKYEYDEIHIYLDDQNMNNISGIGVLSERPELQKLYIMNNYIETELAADFPVMPGITYLEITSANPELPKCFPNLKSVNYSNAYPGTARAFLEECTSLITTDEYGNTANFYKHLYREMWDEERANYTKVSGNVRNIGTFVVEYSFDTGSRSYGGDADYKYSSYTGMANYATDYSNCNFFVVVTKGNFQYYDTYSNGITRAYTTDYYVQFFDIKNKIAYDKIFAAKSYPPNNIYYDADEIPASEYGGVPADKIRDFIKESML
jgi:hypothetical protein